MKKIDIKNSSFVINENASIQQAMESITDNQRGTAIVVDDEFYLVGIVADGDIRRAMVSGATVLAPISKIVNTNPTVITKDEFNPEKITEVFDSESDIGIIPVVDEKNKLVSLAVRNPEKRKEL
ncbi:MAG: CBS domain-containing protein [Candidatus Pacebacteria bacterium]|jgi:arabinose-5-phosphate isomerase|nr:CBS domain-containing protein [Candidatus Paceibacterota bacterium]